MISCGLSQDFVLDHPRYLSIPHLDDLLCLVEVGEVLELLQLRLPLLPQLHQKAAVPVITCTVQQAAYTAQERALAVHRNAILKQHAALACYSGRCLSHKQTHQQLRNQEATVVVSTCKAASNTLSAQVTVQESTSAVSSAVAMCSTSTPAPCEAPQNTPAAVPPAGNGGQISPAKQQV